MTTSKTRRHKICYRSSLHKGAMSSLRRPQRVGSLSTLFLPQSTTKIKIESLTQILPQEKGNTNFQGAHNQGAALGDAYPSRSQAPRVTNMIYQPNDEQMLERWNFQGSQLNSSSSLKGWMFPCKDWLKSGVERWFSAQGVFLRCFAQQLKEERVKGYLYLFSQN